jgi:hypothetical protein
LGAGIRVGRSFVLRCYDSFAAFRPITLTALQILRVVALGASFVGWFEAIQWSATTTLTGAEPNLVLYFALVICISLGIFIFWALVSWDVFGRSAALHCSIGRAPRPRSPQPSPRPADFQAGRGQPSTWHRQTGAGRARDGFLGDPAAFSSSMTGTPLYIWWWARHAGLFRRIRFLSTRAAGGLHSLLAHLQRGGMRGGVSLRVLFGILLIAAGIAILLFGKVRLPFGRLPGDFAYCGKSFAFYFPLASSIVISILLTLFFYLVSRFRR